MSSGQNAAKPARARLVQLDVIRSLAILCVVLVHYQGTFLVGHSVTYSILYSIGELGVPLFVMLSGYLMLGRDYSGEYVKRFLWRNLLPLFIAYELWNILWWIVGLLLPDIGLRASGERNFGQVLSAALLVEGTGNALWFLPMMLGLYLGLPIVSHVLRFLSDAGMRAYGKVLLVCIIIFGTVVPSIDSLSAIFFGSHLHPVINMNIFGTSVWGASVWILYLLVGYWIRQGGLAKVSSWLLFLALFVGLAANIVTKVLMKQHGMSIHVDYSYLFLLITALAAFELLNRTGSFWNGRTVVNAMSTAIAKTSFGMYMVHVWVGQALLLLFAQIGLYERGTVLSLPVGLAIVALFVVLCTFFSWLSVMVLSGWGRLSFSARYLFLMK